MASPALSIIIPVLNEAENVQRNLTALLAQCDCDDEIIVVDGGSEDGTQAIVQSVSDVRVRLIESKRGRARQMNCGATIAQAELLLFHHIDSQLPDDFRLTLEHLTKPCWGRFDVRLDAKGFAFRVIEWFINHRSRLSGVQTGDQSIFVSRLLFDRIGGFPKQDLMEDVELSVRLKSIQTPVCLRQKVITSARKWQREGIVRTVWLMWCLRAQYARGVDPAILVKKYYPGYHLDQTNAVVHDE